MVTANQQLLYLPTAVKLEAAAEDGKRKYSAVFTKRGAIADDGLYFPPEGGRAASGKSIYLLRQHNRQTTLGAGVVSVTRDAAVVAGTLHRTNAAEQFAIEYQDNREYGLGAASAHMIWQSSDARSGSALTRRERDQGIAYCVDKWDVVEVSYVDYGELPDTEFNLNAAILAAAPVDTSDTDDARVAARRSILATLVRTQRWE